MSQEAKLTIAKNPDDQVIVTNPFDGALVDTVAMTSSNDIFKAVLSAKKIAEEFRRSNPAERRHLLNRLADLVERDHEPLAQILCAEVGKTITEARNEARRAVNTLRLSADAATFLDGEVLDCGIVTKDEDRRAVITYEPVGVVGAITPFNYPLNLLCHKLGPAIAAGNAVVAKPSPKAPMAAQRLQELSSEAGFPSGLFTIVHGGVEQAQALATSPINLLSFTGGTAAGLALKQMTGMVRCLMELGGNDPLFVMPDGDLDSALEVALNQRLEIAGQSCAAVKRLFLHEDIVDIALDQLTARISEKVYGDPASETTDMGTVIDLNAAQDVKTRINQAVEKGARILAGGHHKGTLFEPTLVADVPFDAELVSEETFGPVISVRTFKNIDDAVAEVNEGKYGLQAGLFTNDHAVIRKVARELRVGGVMINEGPDFRAEHVPFGGIKGSGLGREGVRTTIREMSETKVVID